MGPLLSETGDLMTQDVGKAEAQNAFIASAVASKTGLQKSQLPETRGKAWTSALVEEDQIREDFGKLDIHRYVLCTFTTFLSFMCLEMLSMISCSITFPGVEVSLTCL